MDVPVNVDPPVNNNVCPITVTLIISRLTLAPPVIDNNGATPSIVLIALRASKITVPPVLDNKVPASTVNWA